MSDFPAIGHVALTVNDLSRSVPWYENLFGAKPPWKVTKASSATSCGCSAVARSLASISSRTSSTSPLSMSAGSASIMCRSIAPIAELEGWEKRLSELGISHGGIVDAPYGSGLSFRDPDNNTLEFFALRG